MPTGTSIVVSTRPATTSRPSQAGSYVRRTRRPGSQRAGPASGPEAGRPGKDPPRLDTRPGSEPEGSVIGIHHACTSVSHDGVPSVIHRVGDESLALGRGGNPARVQLPEPAIATGGNVLVDQIAERRRHEHQRPQRGPGQAEAAKDVEHRRRAPKAPAPGEQP